MELEWYRGNVSRLVILFGVCPLSSALSSVGGGLIIV